MLLENIAEEKEKKLDLDKQIWNAEEHNNTYKQENG